MSIAGFHDVIFPEEISAGSSGGPEFATEIVSLENGHENRNIRWALARHRFDMVWGIKTWEDLRELHSFFLQRCGRGYGFRFTDPLDHSTDWETLSVLTGLTYQMIKNYGAGSTKYVRTITKPKVGTMQVKVGGILKTEGSDYTVDYLTGIITFLGAPGGTVTAICNFHVPCRFDVDFLSINLADYISGAASVPLVGLLI